MAQADSVPSPTRQLITGESASQSTNLRAVNLPAVIKPGDRRYLIGGSHARVIIGGDEAARRASSLLSSLAADRLEIGNFGSANASSENSCDLCGFVFFATPGPPLADVRLRHCECSRLNRQAHLESAKNR